MKIATLLMLLVLSCPLMAAEPATEVEKLVAKLAPGEWGELASQGYDYETLMRGEDILAYSGRAAWDETSRQALFIGQVHLKGPPSFITYAVADNRWRKMPTPAWAESLKWFHAYQNNAADSAHCQFFHHSSSSKLIHKFDVAKQTWTTLPELEAPIGHGTALEYFPEMHGLVHVLGGEVWFLGDGESAWRSLATKVEMGPYHNIASYSKPAGAVLLGGGNDSRAIYRLGADSKLKSCQSAPVDLGIGRSLEVVDPTSGELLVLAKGAKFFAYDPTNDVWRELPTTNLPFPKYDGHSVSTAPLGSLGAVMFFSSRPQGMKTYLYRHAAASK